MHSIGQTKTKTVHMNCFVYRLMGPEPTGLCGD